MKTSDAGRHFIEGWEGLYLHTYNDGVGVPTIGYGHTTAAGPPAVHYGMVITKDQADQFLAADLASVELDVEHNVKPILNQNQFDAIVSFTYNLGVGNLRRSNVLRAINSGHFGEVPHDMLAWDRGGGHFMLGLYRRRVAEGALFSKPIVDVSSKNK